MKRVLAMMMVLGAAVAPASADPGDPDLSNPVLIDGQIRHVDDNQILSILENPFEDGALVGHWIAVRRYEDIPVDYYRIIGNEHFDQWNISVFEVEEDLDNGGQWWLYDEAFLFTIYAPEPLLLEMRSLVMLTPGIFEVLVDPPVSGAVNVMVSEDMMSWSLIDAAVAENGLVEFQDPDWVDGACRFYQAIVP